MHQTERDHENGQALLGLKPIGGTGFLGEMSGTKENKYCHSIKQLQVAHVQVVFHIYEDAELKPLLDAVNDEREKEKEKENES